MVAASLIASSMTILGWLYLAPNHAEPHLNIYARLLLVPYILVSACILLGFAAPRAKTRNPSGPEARVGVLAFAVSVSVFISVPALISATIDRAVYRSIWEPLNAGIRHNDALGAPLAARAAASSTSIDSNVDGPLKLKGEMPLIYPTDFWGRAFEGDTSLRWMPAPQNPLPAWYQLNFLKPVHVSDVALRFWGLPKRCGNHTPESLYLEMLDQNGQVTTQVPLSSKSGQPTLQSKYLNPLVPVVSPSKVSAEPLVIKKTVGGETPTLFDFHAFGKEAN